MRTAEGALPGVRAQVVEEVVQLHKPLLTALNVALKEGLLTRSSRIAVLEDAEGVRRR